MALINLRNALMAGKRLPYDAEVEYLQSTGTQYIDTLVNADSNLSVEITMANAGTPWTNVNPGGVILATPRCRHHLNFNSTLNSNGVNYYFGNGDSCVVTSGYRPADGKVFTFKVDAISKTFTLGSFLGTFPNDTFDMGLSYWLFGRNGTTPPYLGSLRIYSAKLWNGSILVRDFIPVRVGTVGYLYDRVSGKLFGNAGTGDFVLGPDVVPVEYIESHGTEYIDTGVIATNSHGFRVDVATAQKFGKVNTRIFGVHEGNVRCGFSLYGTTEPSGNDFFWGWNAATAFVADIPQRFVVSLNYKNDRAAIFNGMTNLSSLGTLGNTTKSIYLLNANYNGAPFENQYVVGKLYGAEITVGSDVANHFLPVRVGTEGAMMDVLTRRIYRNAGTGAFTYGNDLKYPIPAE